MYHHWHHAHRCGRATSRLFWFIAGAGTATWWHCHKEFHAWQRAHACGRDRIPQHAYPAPGAALPPPSPTAPTAADEQGPTPGTIDSRDRWGWGHGWGQGWGPWGRENANGNGDNRNANWDRWGWGNRGPNGSGKPEGPWAPGTPSEKAAPEKDIMEQATDTIADLSEATLNNLLVTVESLKAKLAEHRAQRDQQEHELQALREAREAKFKQFEEWQRQQEQEQKKDQSPRRLV